MTPQETLASFAKHHHIGLYFNNRSLMKGEPWVQLFARNVCLAEFFSVKEALAWFPIN
jgi:hypothetical protein